MNMIKKSCHQGRRFLLVAVTVLLLTLCAFPARAAETWSGSGDAADPYLLTTAAELKDLADRVNAGQSFTKKYFKLGNDIDLAAFCGENVGGKAVSWTPIGKAGDVTFNGHFDGDGHKVTGLYVADNRDYAGFFGHVTGTVTKLTVEGRVSGGQYVGGVAAMSSGAISNCAFNGTVGGKTAVGGVVGCAAPGVKVEACASSATVSGSGEAVGGVVGAALGVDVNSERNDLANDGDVAVVGGAVTNCVFTGAVTGTGNTSTNKISFDPATGELTLAYADSATGGVVGWSDGYLLKDCVNEGKVEGVDFTGGVVGDSTRGGRVIDCGNKATVTGKGNLTGGVAGGVSDGKLAGGVNSGEVSGKNITGGVAGFVARDAAVDTVAAQGLSAHTGSVNGETVTGGLFGLIQCKITKPLLNGGTVVGGSYTGGVAGYARAALTGCYNAENKTVSGAQYVGGVVGYGRGPLKDCRNAGIVNGKGSAVGGVVGYLAATGAVTAGENSGEVTGGTETGGVVGVAAGVVSRCTGGGTVKGTNSVGGVVGKGEKTISACTHTGVVNSDSYDVGGVVGYFDGTRLWECTNSGAVTGAAVTGGVVGQSAGGEIVAAVNAAGAAVTGNGDTVGGVVGQAEGVLTACVNNAAVHGHIGTGGVVGKLNGEARGCENHGAITTFNATNEFHYQCVGGVAAIVNGTVTSCSNDGEVGGGSGGGIGGIVGYLEEGTVLTCQNSGSVVGASHVGGIVGSERGMVGTDNPDRTDLLVKDCVNYGSVKGSGADIGGIVGSAQIVAAISGCVNEKTGKVEGTRNIGGIVGYYRSDDPSNGNTLNHCFNKGSVTAVAGNSLVGGVVGYLFNGVMEYCGSEKTAKIQGKGYVGGVAGVGETGYFNTTIRYCHNSAVVNGSGERVGGIVGEMENKCTVKSCYNDGKITSTQKHVGGIVGEIDGDALVESCYNKGAVDGGKNDYVGGVVGYCQPSATPTIRLSCNAGTVNGEGNVGGLVGRIYDGKVERSYNSGKVVATGARVGGCVGEQQGKTVIENCYNIGYVEGWNYVGGVAGNMNEGATLRYCYNYSDYNGEGNCPVANYDKAFYGKLVGHREGNGPTLYHNVYTDDRGRPVGWDHLGTDSGSDSCKYFDNGDMKVTKNFRDYGWKTDPEDGIWRNGDKSPELYMGGLYYGPDNGPETAARIVDIATAADLLAFAQAVNEGDDHKDAVVRLVADIDLTGIDWPLIGDGVPRPFTRPFAGVFDGGGHTISGLYVNDENKRAALFDEVTGTVRDLLVRGSLTGNIAAGIAINNKGTVERCAFYGDVTVEKNNILYSYVGGIVARNDGAIVDCAHVGNVKGAVTYVGGVVGANYALDSSSHYAAGANITEPIRNCYHFGGSVSGGQYNGGVAGRTEVYRTTAGGRIRAYSGIGNCFYQEDTAAKNVGRYVRNDETYSGSIYVNDASSLSTEKFKDDRSAEIAKNFPDWDFDDVWAMGLDSPRLRSLSRQIIISRNGSNATGSMPDPWLLQSGERLFSTYVPKENFSFGGWNTESDGSGVSYADGETVYPSPYGTLKLYAQWFGGNAYRRYLPVSATHPGSTGENYENLFDNDLNTKWRATGLSAGTDCVVEFTAKDYIKPSAYCLTTAADAGDHPEYNPTGWILEAKAQAEDEWVAISGFDSGGDLPNVGKKAVYFPLDVDDEYCFFRLTFRGGGTLQLAEMYLLVSDPDADVRQPRLSFYANGGKGDTSPQRDDNGADVTLTANGYSRGGFTFAGWNTDKEGNGVAYDDKGAYRVNGDAILFAQWTPNRYTVKWVDDDGRKLDEQTLDGGVLPVYGGEALFKADANGKRYTFAGWSPTVAVVSGDATYTARYDETVTDYAITVTYGENGVAEASAATATANTPVTITVKPNDGYDLATLTATAGSGEVPLTKNEDGTYGFTMPESAVTVNATFKACPSHHFTDVDHAAWYHQYVDYVVEKGLMKGITATTFEPATATSRAMLVMTLYRLAGEQEISGKSPFKDVKDNSWYGKAVIWAYENKIVDGYGGGKFGPNDPVTREQLVTIFFRYSGKMGYDVKPRGDLSKFKDENQISGYAKEAMSWAVAVGLVEGMNDGTVAPKDDSTRAQIAAILTRFCENLMK